MWDSVTVFQTQTTVIADGTGATVTIGDNLPGRGLNVGILVNFINGDPNTVFGIQTSPDNVSWFLNTVDEFGPVNVNTQRTLHFTTRRPYARLCWLMNRLEPGLGSGNSSSCSAQSFNSSSSCSGGTAIQNAIGFVAQAQSSLTF